MTLPIDSLLAFQVASREACTFDAAAIVSSEDAVGNHEIARPDLVASDKLELEAGQARGGRL